MSLIDETILNPIKEIGSYKFCRMLDVDNDVLLEIKRIGCDDPYKHKRFFKKVCEFNDLDMCDFMSEFKKDVKTEIDLSDIVYEKDKERIIRKALLKLKPREERVLRLRFFNDLTYAEVAKKFGVSKERIRQIEKKALRKLKHKDRLGSEDVY